MSSQPGRDSEMTGSTINRWLLSLAAARQFWRMGSARMSSQLCKVSEHVPHAREGNGAGHLLTGKRDRRQHRPRSVSLTKLDGADYPQSGDVHSTRFHTEYFILSRERVGFEKTSKRRFNNMQSTGSAQNAYKTLLVRPTDCKPTGKLIQVRVWGIPDYEARGKLQIQQLGGAR
jgi:hypothetical protein